LIALSDFVVNSYLTIFAGLFVGIGGIYVWKRTPGGAYHWDNLMLHLPIVGRMIRNVSLAKFTRTLGSLLNSGITIVKGLQIDADAEDVSRGIPLAENLTDSRFLFPDMVVSMISIGEQTAELSTVCDKIANYYDEQVDQMASNMSKLMEPLIMVTMGVIVGGLIVSVMQPIFSLLDVVGNL
jgi:type IV pilus assembly protein PilC